MVRYLLCATVFLSANRSGFPADASSGTIPNYTAVMERYYAFYTHGSPTESLKQHPESEAATSPALANYALELWQATKKPDYLEKGKIVFDNIVAANQPISALGTFATSPITNSCRILMGAGKASPEAIQWVRSQMLAIQAKGYHFRHGNRELGALFGPAQAAFQIWPNDPAFEPTRTQFKEWWHKANAIGDLDENSGNYSSIGLMELSSIVRMMGREQDIKQSARWHNTFTRYRDMVTPSGGMPEWGDDYFEEGGKFAFVALFEYAASLYGDPTFATAARKCYSRRVKWFVDAKQESPHWELHILGAYAEGLSLLTTEVLKKPLEPNPLVNGITHRYDEIGVEKPDKLLLRPSLNPGSPALMVDLYAYGDHSHYDREGSIDYYEVDNVSLFKGGYGRYLARQNGDGGNAFYLQPDGETFPINTWKPGVWKTVSIPTERLAFAGNPPDVARRVVPVFTSTGTPGGLPLGKKTKPGASDSTLTIDNIRLEGPAGIKVIDDFEDTSAKLSRLHYVTDASHGKSAAQIAPSNANFSTRPSSVEFNVADYKVLSYDIKQTGNPALEDLSFRTADAPNHTHTYGGWHSVAPGPFYAALANAKTDKRGDDCFAELNYDGYGTFDSKLTRRMVLTKEGVLVIQDTFVPGKRASSWTGGSVWQLPTLAAQGKNWFASEVIRDVSCDPQDTSHYAHGMLVYFSADTGSEYGVKTITYGKGEKRYIAFSKQPVEIGKPIALTTVVIPTDEGIAPETYANGVGAASGATEVKVKLPHTELHVRIADAIWSVKR